MKQIRKIVIGYLIVFVFTAGILSAGLFQKSSNNKNKTIISTVALEMSK